jgi:hypothetical protein
MNKIDLTDLTLNIPVFIDSDDRLKNFKTSMSWLMHHFDVNITIMEIGTSPVLRVPITERLKYYFQPDLVFHKTRYLNEMCKLSNTPFTATYDVDVIFEPVQFLSAVNKLRNDECDAIFPYDGKFLNIEHEKRIKALNEMSLSSIDVNNQHYLGNRVSVGGCLIWNKKKYIEGGMENQNCISWGFEDDECFERFSKLGYRIKRQQGHLYHMHHSRGPTSSSNHQNYLNNEREYHRIKSMDVETLKQEISTWKWLK